MQGSIRSPLGRLVLFIVGLSIAGALVAGTHYALVDLPGQVVRQAPTNAGPDPCAAACAPAYHICISGCSGNGGCIDTCYQVAETCAHSCGIEIMG
ncbi:MAG TPA: hypothetical protein HA272_08110 [Methanoregula sp.]|nr:hypothetical protein [Methanoregula sp.]